MIERNVLTYTVIRRIRLSSRSVVSRGLPELGLLEAEAFLVHFCQQSCTVSIFLGILSVIYRKEI